MKQAGIYIALVAQNGTKTTPFLAYGAFINPLKFRMDPIGIFGEQSKKLPGKRIINFG